MVPIAIVIAGIMIAGSIYCVGKKDLAGIDNKSANSSTDD